MSNTHIFNLSDVTEGYNCKLNIDELFETKQKEDLKKLTIFNKILKRVHDNIKKTSKNKNQQFTFFIVPEFILGVPKYDQGVCIAYLMDQLSKNEFIVKYINPNVLFISWGHYFPKYIRDEIKKKMKLNVDHNGNVLDNENDDHTQNIEINDDMNPLILGKPEIQKAQLRQNNQKKSYKPISDFKPSGIYSNDLLRKFEEKIND